MSFDISHMRLEGVVQARRPSRSHFSQAQTITSREENWKMLATGKKYSFLPRQQRGREKERERRGEPRNLKGSSVSVHRRGARVKNDIKFKSSLNKKSLSEARGGIIHSAENSEVKYPPVGPRDSRSSISTSCQTKSAKRKVSGDDLFRENAR